MKRVVKKRGSGGAAIEPIQEKSYDLDELLKGITAKNVHKLVDFGVPVGKELWSATELAGRAHGPGC